MRHVLALTGFLAAVCAIGLSPARAEIGAPALSAPAEVTTTTESAQPVYWVWRGRHYWHRRWYRRHYGRGYYRYY